MRLPAAELTLRGRADATPWCDGVDEVAIVEAGGIEALVALVRNDDGAVGGQEQAAWALANLASDNDANKVAIVAAGAVDPLIENVYDADTALQAAALGALEALDLASIASRVQTLQAKNGRLRARVRRLRARVEELEERYERPRQRDRMEAAQ